MRDTKFALVLLCSCALSFVATSPRAAAAVVPLDRLMLETDCPYMSPEPMRRQKLNEPALIIHTARFLAELKQIDFADFAKAVTATTKAFFNLPQ